MAQFKNAHASHAHSLETFEMLYEYDDFLYSLEVVADMGCGAGLDTAWWATLKDRQDPPEPHNYTCYAVDHNTEQIEPSVLSNSNVVPVQGDFSTRLIPRQIDLIWCHDAFQYALNPLQTLAVWNQNMNVNGMLILSLPLHQAYHYNRLNTQSHSGCYYHYNICNLMYMLAVSGFDCKDSYFSMTDDRDWLTAAVYKTIDPQDPVTTTWHDLADLNLVNDSVKQSLNRYGYVRQEELVFTWLDRDFYFAKS
jgi:SAM-dependent methyltransferase